MAFKNDYTPGAFRYVIPVILPVLIAIVISSYFDVFWLSLVVFIVVLAVEATIVTWLLKRSKR